MKRDVPIDVIRGLCIVSMVVAHLAYGSPLSRVINVSTLVDGASGFFLLSGLVLGIVYERRQDRMTIGQVRRKLARRAGMLYGIHVGLVLLAIGLGSVLADGHEWADWDVLGFWSTLVATSTLTLNPPGFGILSVYVPLMLMAAVIVPLLRMQRGRLAVGLVVGIYAASLLWPAVFILPDAPGAGGFWNWGGWQGLFFIGVFTGWNWRRLAIRDRLLSRRGIALSVTGLVGGFAMWRLLNMGAVQSLLLGADGELLRWTLFNKGDMGPMRAVIALSTMALLYALATAAYERNWLGGPIAVIARIGRKSLDSFVISRFVVMALPLWATYEPSAWYASVVAVLTLAAGWLWAKLREEHGAPVSAARSKVLATLTFRAPPTV